MRSGKKAVSSPMDSRMSMISLGRCSCSCTSHRRLFFRYRGFSTTTLQYQPPRVDNIEDVENYRPGGFHPISIGDVFHDNRYRVLRKLGFGGHSTVWLARDRELQRVVSLKVLSAKSSHDCKELAIYQQLWEECGTVQHPGRPYICSLLNHFSLTGPNGTHLCLVHPIAGPSISSLSNTPGQPSGSRRVRCSLAQKFEKQIALALDYLHFEGICHGDLSASKVLLRLAHVDSWSDQLIYEQLGIPVAEELCLSSTSTNHNMVAAPKYVIEPADLGALDPKWFAEEILLTDFGQSFPSTSPPPDGLGTPLSYSSPELLFDQRASTQSDMWALGCTIFEVHAGTPLFASFFGGPDEVIRQWVQALGKLPEPWWLAWAHRYTYFDDCGKPRSSWPSNRPLAVEYPLRAQVEDIGAEYGDTKDTPNTAGGPSMIEQPGVHLSQADIDILEDLLSKLIVYAPEQRLSI